MCVTRKRTATTATEHRYARENFRKTCPTTYIKSRKNSQTAIPLSYLCIVNENTPCREVKHDTLRWSTKHVKLLILAR